MSNEILLVLNYINDFHWIWYGIGFILCPELTIMIMLQIHFKNFIPPILVLIGWLYAIFKLFLFYTLLIRNPNE